MATQNTHTQLYFMRTVRVRREHIQGDADDGTNGLMRVVPRGSVFKLIAPQARYLIVDETALEVKGANKEAIEADKAELSILEAAREQSEASETKRKTRTA